MTFIPKVLLLVIAILICEISPTKAPCQLVLFDVNFDDDLEDEPPFTDFPIMGETATFPTQISGGVLVADGWTDNATGQTLGGDGDLVAVSEAFATSRFDFLEILPDDLPSPESQERFLQIRFDYLLDTELAGGGQGRDGSQNLFLRMYNSENTIIGSAFLKTNGLMQVTNQNVEWLGPDDPEGFFSLADSIGPRGEPGTFQMQVDLTNWTYHAVAEWATTAEVPLLDDGANLKDVVAFSIEHFDTDGEGGLRSDSLLVYDNFVIELQPDDPGIMGDYDNNGVLDTGDLVLQADAMVSGAHPVEFDLTGNGKVDFEDRQHWVEELKGTWIGDADLDGEFNTTDLVGLFQLGKFEKNEIARWGEGDFDGDTRFNTSDFVVAFQDGGFERGPRLGFAPVPEPSSFGALVVSACLSLLSWGRRRV